MSTKLCELIKMAVCLCLAAPFGLQSLGAAADVQDRLPILLIGAGHWLDRPKAEHGLDVILPAQGNPLALTNFWSVGRTVLSGDAQFFTGVLLLSNAWNYSAAGPTEEQFWRARGQTNAPLKIAIPGGRGFFLLVANSRVLPFVARSGTETPDAIWAIPRLPVKLNNATRTADISMCSVVSLNSEKLNLSGWLTPVSMHQTWRFTIQSGLPALELVLSSERDW